jgi:hypothetical protein
MPGHAARAVQGIQTDKPFDFPVFSRVTGNRRRGDEFADDCFLRHQVAALADECSSLHGWRHFPPHFRRLRAGCPGQRLGESVLLEDGALSGAEFSVGQFPSPVVRSLITRVLTWCDQLAALANILGRLQLKFDFALFPISSRGGVSE